MPPVYIFGNCDMASDVKSPLVHLEVEALAEKFVRCRTEIVPLSFS